jgi:capsular polysaccharide biosynthesis protein/Mrp family chromosome partitioning ATPase
MLVAAAIAWKVTPSRYVATAQVRVHNDFVVQPDQGQITHWLYLNNQAYLVRLPQVLHRASMDPRVRDIPELTGLTVEHLQEIIDVRFSRDSEIMLIIVRHQLPAAAQAWANAVTSSFVKEVEKSEVTATNQRMARLEAAVTIAEEKLAKSYSDLSALARELGVADTTTLSLQKEMILENQRENVRRLRQIQSERSAAQRAIAETTAGTSLNSTVINSLVNEEKGLEGSVAEIERQLKALGGDKAVELERVRRELALHTSTANTLRQALQSCQIEKEADVRIAVQSWADLPRRADQSDRKKAAASFGIGAAAFVLLFIGIWQLRFGPRATLKELSRLAEFPILGAIPKLSQSAIYEAEQSLVDDKLIRQGEMQPYIGAIAAKLRSFLKDARHKVVLITGVNAVPNQSTFAAYLSRCLAIQGRNLLFVNCDDSQPVKSASFQLHMNEPMHAGEVIGHISAGAQKDARESISESFTDKLRLSGIVDLKELAWVLPEVQNYYDLTIVNVPSVLTSAEAGQIAAIADWAIIAVDENAAPMPKVREAFYHLDYQGVSLMGVVVLNVEHGA